MKEVTDAVNEFKGVFSFPDYNAAISGWYINQINALSCDGAQVCTREEFNQCVDEMSNNFGPSCRVRLLKWQKEHTLLFSIVPVAVPTFTQVMADEGVLPIVGMECEFETTFFTLESSNTGTCKPIAFHGGKVWLENGDSECVINLNMITFKPLTPPKTDTEIAIDFIIEKTIKEMEIRFELKSNHDDSLTNDDTQIGVEFATEFMRSKLIQLLEVTK